MTDLEIIELLLNHPFLQDQVRVTDTEISGRFNRAVMHNSPEKVEAIYTEIADAMPGRKTTRLYDDVIIEREPETETAN